MVDIYFPLALAGPLKYHVMVDIYFSLALPVPLQYSVEMYRRWSAHIADDALSLASTTLRLLVTFAATTLLLYGCVFGSSLFRGSAGYVRTVSHCFIIYRYAGLSIAT